jgi:hypothetical protein
MKIVPHVLVVAALASLAAAGCSSPTSPAPPAAPTPTPTPSPAPSPTPSGSLTGAWTGTGTDPQGGERMSWMVTQNGDTLSGTADLAPLNAADGSCASCHKLKTGTLQGTVSGAGVALKLVFPAGGDGVPTPMCMITVDAVATVGDNRLTANYTGNDTCEGPFAGGTFVMSR